eukprot:Hpha_TRINITY_DN15688_c1_g6::TRINITY_DN15688_c1_g6_i1::g.101436::m.101436
MGELLIHLRCGDRLLPVEVPADGTVANLVGAASEVTGFHQLLLRMGGELLSPADILADTGLCSEAVVDVEPRGITDHAHSKNVKVSEEGGGLLATSADRSQCCILTGITFPESLPWESPVLTVEGRVGVDEAEGSTSRIQRSDEFGMGFWTGPESSDGWPDAGFEGKLLDILFTKHEVDVTVNDTNCDRFCGYSSADIDASTRITKGTTFQMVIDEEGIFGIKINGILRKDGDAEDGAPDEETVVRRVRVRQLFAEQVALMRKSGEAATLHFFAGMWADAEGVDISVRWP